MRVADKWKDYELLDCSSGQRLERWGDVILIRPDPQVIWKTEKTHPLWYKAHAVYNRSSSGGGKWDIRRKIPDAWKIKYGDLSFMVKPMGFKHTGVFPEQAVNWDMTAEIIRKERRPLRVLNLLPIRALRRFRLSTPARMSPMSMPQRAWSPGRRRTPQSAALQMSPCAGSLTTA